MKTNCATCDDRRSITHEVPTAPHMPSSLPVSVDCPDCVKRCACGATNRYLPFVDGHCRRCAGINDTIPRRSKSYETL
jgi:endogenous inhibitor of DNA gyrase (YacG/DUF329 family)